MNDDLDETMDPQQHPENRQILDYLTAPEAQRFAELRLHLASCRYCRRRTELTSMLRDQGHWLEAERVDVDARIQELLAGRLDAQQAAALRRQLKQDPAQLRAALHYASHAKAMPALQPDDAARVKPRSIAWPWLTELLGFEAALWKTVPVVALVLTVTALLLRPLLVAETPRVVAFQDHSMIRFVAQHSQPGIGFFAQSTTDARPFDGIKVEVLSNRRIRLSWSEVEDVLGYKLKLQVFRDGETRVLARSEVKDTVAELELAEALTQHRYEWVLSGDTLDKRSFQTSGGFVVSSD